METDPEAVAAVNGSILRGEFIDVAGNGVEAGPARAVVIVIDDVTTYVRPAAGFSMVNTEIGSPLVRSDPIEIDVEFADPVAVRDLGFAPFNPFLIVNRQRSREVHAADGLPTTLADGELFGSGDDTSVPEALRYYRTERNLPWAMILAGGFRHMVEGQAIISGYIDFATWAESGGSFATGWYLSLRGNMIEDNVWRPGQ